MITHFTNLSLMLQNDLPFQMMATFGTSPQIMAPLFNMLCVALLCLALTYLIYMVINDNLQRPLIFKPITSLWATNNTILSSTNILLRSTSISSRSYA